MQTTIQKVARLHVPDLYTRMMRPKLVSVHVRVYWILQPTNAYRNALDIRPLEFYIVILIMMSV